MNFGIIPSSWSGPILSLLRIMTGLLFVAHGTAKFFTFPPTQYFPEAVPLLSMVGLTGALELVGGILIIIGLFTRIAAFVLSGFMAVAYFMVHAPQGFYPINNGGELAIMYCFVFLYLAAAGPGPWSLDAQSR
ncbi:MAG: DoxX family protein [Hyphomicrobiales bacterium]